MKLMAAMGERSPVEDSCPVEFYFEEPETKFARDCSGKLGERLFVRERGGRKRMAAGIGPKDKFSPDVLRKSGAEAAVDLAGRGVRGMSFKLSSWPGEDSAEAAVTLAESVRLSQYRFSLHSTPPKEKFLDSLSLICRSAAEQKSIAAHLAQISAVADGVDLARDISNLPGNLGQPAVVADMAKRMAGGGIKVTVLDRRACERLGMGAFLSVARGSDSPPAFLVLEYTPGKTDKSVRPICVVGKGVTFDSGGISIKPADKMEEMKHDKSGAAAVIGIFAAAKTLKPRIPLVGLVPLTENLSGGNASRPGDVVKSLSGKTIEIKNTDAEGRLILADALTYAGKFRPQAIIDLATLTGAASIALGDVYSAILSNNDALARSLADAGDRCGELLWRLPMHDGYERLIKSSVADVQNIPEGRLAGTIIGGMFLKKFLPDDKIPWAHIDIAATAWDIKGRDGRPAGSTGIGVRLFYEFLKTRGDV